MTLFEMARQIEATEAHRQADADGTHEYAQREIAQDQAAEEFKLIAEENSVPSLGPGRLGTPEAVRTFIFAGNAYLTVRSTRTGTRFTFRVSAAKPKPGRERWTGNTFFVSVLNGPENTKDYLYVGMIRDLKFQLTKASRVREEAASFKAFRWVYQHISQNVMPKDTEIWHEGRCGRCGRKLTVPEYRVNGVVVAGVAIGLGPECAGLGGEA
jgi:hypothetical protein